MTNLVESVRQYIAEMMRISGPGMKVLLMDKETTSIISCVYAQSEIMQKETYLFERIDSGILREPIRHLKCIAFLRPTSENVALLAQEFRSPRYGQYFVYFSNVISKADVKILAEADEQEVVREMQEFFADFVALSPHLFTLNLPNCYHYLSLSPVALKTSTQSVASVLLALRKTASMRYQGSSEAAKRLAENIQSLINKESTLFKFKTKSDDGTLLLILDRRGDPVTPLLNKWTYEAMVHELIGIKNNRVHLVASGGSGDADREIILNPLQDHFYNKCMYLNFGEIGQQVREVLNEYQKKAETHQKIESISDIKTFIEHYPEFKKFSGTVEKHVLLISELNRLVDAYNLLEISELEQQIACRDEQSSSQQRIRALLRHEKTSDLDATRLVMLYALRYGSSSASGELRSLVELLRKRGVPEKYCQAVRSLLEFSSGIPENAPEGTLGNIDPIRMTKKLIRDFKGVENIYIQHQPRLVEILDQIAKGKLMDSLYPYVESSPILPRVSEVIIFMIGGATFEESLAVHNFNMSSSSVRAVLGGTNIHNARR
ncbi:unnamed protein product [Soboliphyme baturini]|uniref:Vacuolar protein sorting-associated protein 45 n=1 Tax=Soboliphyme baturini TaxID=241478 RepID=A0A183ILN6_9BILA|nr:unnamed protein product [Soboliphyme baturini]